MEFDLQSASAGDLVYIVLLCLGCVLGLKVVLGAIFRFGLPVVAVRPIVPFAMFFTVIHFVTPLVKYVGGIYRYQSYYSEASRIYIALLSLSLLLFATLLSASREFGANPKVHIARLPASRGEQRYTVVALAIYALGGMFALQDVYVIVNDIGYSRFLSDVHWAGEMRSSFRIFSNLMILGAALILSSLLSKVKKTRSTYVKIAFVAGPVVAYAIVLNSRNTMFITVMTLVAVYMGFVFDSCNLVRRRRFWSVRSVTVYHLIFLSVVLAFLYFSLTSMSTQRYSISDSAYVVERRERLLLYSIDGAFGNDENLLWLAENNDYDYLYGRTYMDGLLVIIPRQIWPSKPLGAGPYLINLIRPGSYVENADGNNSLTTGLLTESMMNFGLPGTFGGVFAWAFLSSRFIRAFYRSVNLFYRTAFLISALLISTTFLYQEFLGFFGRSFVVVAPLFVLGYIVGPPKSEGSRYKVAT
mgnify:CR=1 FL=1